MPNLIYIEYALRDLVSLPQNYSLLFTSGLLANHGLWFEHASSLGVRLTVRNHPGWCELRSLSQISLFLFLDCILPAEMFWVDSQPAIRSTNYSDRLFRLFYFLG